MRGPENLIHIFGDRFHVKCHVTFDVNKPRKFKHWLNYPRPRFWLRYFVVDNFHCGEAYLCSKLIFFFVLYVLLFSKKVDISLPLKWMLRMLQAALWREIIKLVVRAYSDVSDQVFSGR